jgi:hypothetical protein
MVEQAEPLHSVVDLDPAGSEVICMLYASVVKLQIGSGFGYGSEVSLFPTENYLNFEVVFLKI